MDLLWFYLKGLASWFIDYLTTAPADLDALKLTLIKTFDTKRNKYGHSPNEENEHRNKYIVDRETLRLKLPEELSVQIAVDRLEPSFRSTISLHGHGL